MEARPPTSRPAGGVVRGGHLDDGEERLGAPAAGRAGTRARYAFESSVHVKRMEARPPTRRPPAAWSAAGTSTTAKSDPARRAAGALDPLRYAFESSSERRRVFDITSREVCKNAANKADCSWSKSREKCKSKRKKCAEVKNKKTPQEERGDDIDGEAADDHSGISVSLSADGTTLAVGAHGTTAGDRAGHAVFGDSVDETWVQRGDDIDGEAAGDDSLLGVAERGRHDAGRRGALQRRARATAAGHARVFAWDSVDETWKQRGDDIDGEAAGDESGWSVSLSADGTTLAVGAYTNDGTGSIAGHARMFAWDPDDETWVQRGDDIDGEAADDWSGYSVSLSADGTTLAVGAPYNDGGGTDAGHVRVFAWDPVEETWVQRGDDIDGEAANDYSGISVSLSADGTALARGDDIDGEAAYDWSGYSVSLSADGTALAVGAPYNDGAGSFAGHARVFAWDPVEETWVQRGDDIDGEAANDHSGYSVSLSADGTTLAVGADYNDGAGSNAGHARVYSILSALGDAPAYAPALRARALGAH
ncbi:hypothetical protein JL721_9305 [Aureococcus anophagefferens]|nr:hypothetical protein JL721_9305 [Aureococcus anophagefferens]